VLRAWPRATAQDEKEVASSTGTTSAVPCVWAMGQAYSEYDAISDWEILSG
jgi:hypothetical protein